jgi:hypothetical protein
VVVVVVATQVVLLVGFCVLLVAVQVDIERALEYLGKTDQLCQYSYYLLRHTP